MPRDLQKEAVFVSITQIEVRRRRVVDRGWGVNWWRNVDGLVDGDEGWSTGVGEDKDKKVWVHEDVRWDK